MKNDFYMLDEMIKKCEKYDELESWYQWLKRRTNNRRVSKQYLETFLSEIENIFEQK